MALRRTLALVLPKGKQSSNKKGLGSVVGGDLLGLRWLGHHGFIPSSDGSSDNLKDNTVRYVQKTNMQLPSEPALQNTMSPLQSTRNAIFPLQSVRNALFPLESARNVLCPVQPSLQHVGQCRLVSSATGSTSLRNEDEPSNTSSAQTDEKPPEEHASRELVRHKRGK